MAEREKGEREPMPEVGNGWVQVNAGPHLNMLFMPRELADERPPDGIIRRRFVVALAGSKFQAFRGDPFSVEPHYHIRPIVGEGQIPLVVADGQTPLAAALMLVTDGDGFRTMLIQGDEEPAKVMEIEDKDLVSAAEHIRRIDAAYAA